MRANNLKAKASSLRVLPTYLITILLVIILLTAISSAQTPPTATTGSASMVTSSKATLNGTVNPNGFSTNYYFQYGTTTSYVSSTPRTSAGSGKTPVSASASISGLTPNTTYHFRIVAISFAGTSYGNDNTFTTSPPAQQLPPTVATGSATAIGSYGSTRMAR